MATNSLNEDRDSFNEVTLEKLDIYARYLREWLPVSKSPKRQVVLHDTNSEFVNSMASTLGTMIRANDRPLLAHVHYQSQSHGKQLKSLLRNLQRNRSANLLFLDQNGISNSGAAEFSELHTLKSSDLLIYVSSEWFQRFSGSGEAELWGMRDIDIQQCRYSHIHRFMTSYFRNLVGHECYVAPYSFRQHSSVNALMFITHNPLRLEKFLKAAWHRDPWGHDANFDLYDDSISTKRLALVGVKKITEFQKELLACLECGKFRSDRDIYLHCLQRGFLGRHAAATVRVFCERHNVRFQTRAGSLARPRLSHACFYHPRPMVYH